MCSFRGAYGNRGNGTELRSSDVVPLTGVACIFAVGKNRGINQYSYWLMQLPAGQLRFPFDPDHRYDHKESPSKDGLSLWCR